MTPLCKVRARFYPPRMLFDPARFAIPAGFPVELLTPAQMGEADRLTIDSGTPGLDLMERVGAAVADAARQMMARGGLRTVLVLAGPGNNGGDGFVAARLLRRMGFDLRLALLGSADQLRGDAALAAARWEGEILPAGAVDLPAGGLLIDALFGAGLNRRLDGEALDLVRRINDWRRGGGGAVLAVDVPSGLDGATGLPLGGAIAAYETVTFFRLKPGHLLEPGRSLCGRIRLEQIGIAPAVLDTLAPAALINTPGLWSASLPLPGASSHKYTRGHVQAVSGPAARTGAVRLAARGALRAGAGLVTVLAHPDALAEHAARLDAIMLEACPGATDLAAILQDHRRNAVVIGPGAGVNAAVRAKVEALLQAPNSPAAVLDADALSVFEADAQALGKLIRAREGGTVITPHEGEFARLFKNLAGLSESVPEQPESNPERPDSLPEGRLQRASYAARALGSVTVLKGAATVIAAPDGRAAINANAPPWLATAGSGDVLAGMTAGLLAQGMPEFEAACAAVWMHGEAARIFGPGLVAEDMPEALPQVLQYIWGAQAIAPVR